METQKLSTVDAFVVRDLPGADKFVGAVRVAPKILTAGAQEMARSITYRYALLNKQVSGASAGVNAKPEDRIDALAKFVAEVSPAVDSGTLHLDATGAVRPADLEGLSARDSRGALRDTMVDNTALTDRLVALGANASADEVLRDAGGLGGHRVVIEGFNTTGPTLAAAAVAYGATVVGVSTPKGAVANPDGFDPDVLATAFAQHGAEMINDLGLDPQPANRVFGQPCDVFYAGSKMGVVTHVSAEYLNAKVVVPTGPVPVTTKAMLMLRDKGAVVLPDFLTTAGPAFAEWPEAGTTVASVETSAQTAIRELTRSLLGTDDGPTLEACYRAESFLRTWQDQLPFGRPFAA